MILTAAISAPRIELKTVISYKHTKPVPKRLTHGVDIVSTVYHGDIVTAVRAHDKACLEARGSHAVLIESCGAAIFTQWTRTFVQVDIVLDLSHRTVTIDFDTAQITDDTLSVENIELQSKSFEEFLMKKCILHLNDLVELI